MLNLRDQKAMLSFLDLLFFIFDLIASWRFAFCVLLGVGAMFLLTWLLPEGGVEILGCVLVAIAALSAAIYWEINASKE